MCRDLDGEKICLCFEMLLQVQIATIEQNIFVNPQLYQRKDPYKKFSIEHLLNFM